ncbi:hypothetical protein DE146DRAFT_757147 [Phaeosphaeria sp. MPI-PUGE-AT-0046c]|nr:hypothetical protein DE146DRAFT_757147 [Phaeosphaeria sp. MPI-PUGE-AT-0046c]
MPGCQRQNSWWSENRDLYNLLLRFRESRASDPRDNIYALLGISSDAQDVDILKPDYTKSLQEIIRDTSSFLFGSSNITYKTVTSFLTDISSRNTDSFLNIVRTASVSDVDHFLVQNEVKVTEDLIIATTEDMKCGGDVVGLLLQQCRSQFDYFEVKKALQVASSRGNENAVKLLLDNAAILQKMGGPYNVPDEFYGYTLCSASAHGQTQVIRLLLDRIGNFRDSDPLQIDDTRDISLNMSQHFLALALASAHGHVHVVELLLDLSASFYIPESKSYLIDEDMRASKNAALGLLLLRGAIADKDGVIYIDSLCLASGNGYEQVVMLLLDKGAESNVGISIYSEERLSTALQAASVGRHKKVVKLLLKRGDMP